MKKHSMITAASACGASLLATIGMTAATAPAAAAPAPSPGAHLSIVARDIVNPAYSRVMVDGVFPMQEADAVGFLTHLRDNGQVCGTMHYVILGDDGNEQYLFDSNYRSTDDIEGYLKASPRGLEYRREIVVPRATLNEDKDGADEIFVRAQFLDADCGSRIQTTHVATGDF